jgi:malate dehydrogenase
LQLLSNILFNFRQLKIMMEREMKITMAGAAGTVGSCTSYTLAMQGLASEILMLDTKKNVLENHVMDISAALAGRNRTNVHSGDYQDMPGSDIVIISAGIHLAGIPARERLAPNIPIMREIAANIERYCPQAVVITASNPVDLLNYTLYLGSSLERRKLIGYNLNDTLRFRMAVARTLGVDASTVEAIAAGDHPAAPVQLFSSIKVNGRPVPVDAQLKPRLQEELRSYLKTFESLKAGRTAGWTSASGIASMVKAISENEGRLLSCSAILEGEYGFTSLSMGVPVIIGREGIREIVQWELPADERMELESAAQTLRANCDFVRETLGSKRP